MQVSSTVFRGSPEGHILSSEITRTLAGHEVFIETTHSGVCPTDEHLRKSSQVLGHEGVGVIRAYGKDVSSLKVGDRVGWDQYCRNQKQYASHDLDNGTFSSGAVWDAKYVYPIPAGYDSVHTAPLMCAGATVWTVLSQYGIRFHHRVAIMGIGGLGHLAIKIAAAMGRTAVVLSSSVSKKQEAMDYGASEFQVFRSGQSPPENFEPIQHLLLCGNAAVEYSSLIPLTDTHGTIYPLTVAFEPASVPMLDLVSKGIRTLLEFAVRKKIIPTTMSNLPDTEGIQKAVQDSRDGGVKYRAVLVRAK
ncbi:alcohol dehydrogenase [Polychaeton citri CBS 116435]|uniref:Alcohol dehydrogenase n=1 Tax=Polychaeton citri CBS 116435 TaxID=1314669 RepID=A0A9P4UPS0_9PEZI|nr:alcohol dehydrogenase [Polychaeton citri CBS 116435]